MVKPWQERNGDRRHGERFSRGRERESRSRSEAAVTPGADLKKDLTGTDLEKDLTDLTEADPEDHLSPSKTGVEEENQPLDQVCRQ